MALLTLTPPMKPSLGTTNKPKIKLLKNDFGDGYTQPAPDGINHIKRVMTLYWELLTPTQCEAMDTFMTQHGGCTPFLWTPSDEVTAIQWRCEDWDWKVAKKGGFREFNAVFEQDFSLV